MIRDEVDQNFVVFTAKKQVEREDCLPKKDDESFSLDIAFISMT